MNDFESVLKRITVTRLEPGDYTGEDGLLYCGKCRTPKQFRMEAPPLEGRLLPHPCHCEQERLDREAAEQEARRHRQAVCNFVVGTGLVTAGVVFPSKWCAVLGVLGIISSVILRHESGGRKDEQ